MQALGSLKRAVLAIALAAALVMPAAAQNVVVNGDFESGWVTNPINGWVGQGWTVWKTAPAAAFWGMPLNNGSLSPGNDYQRLIGGNIQSSTIGQGIVQAVPTVPGTVYDFDFDAAFAFILWGGDWDPWLTGASFGFDLTGQTSNPNATSIVWLPIALKGDVWDHYHTRFTAAGAQTSIWFRSFDNTGQRTQLVDIDNVRVAPATASLITIMSSPAMPAVRITQLTPTSFRVEWTTDVASDSRVEYDTTPPGKGADEGVIAFANSKSDPALVTGHSITLTGLTLDTRYYVRVVSSAPGYKTVYSGTVILDTPPEPLDSFRNGSFEEWQEPVPGQRHPLFWRKFGVVDGVRGVADMWGVAPFDGQYFIGSRGSFVTKNGGYFQHFRAVPGKVYSVRVKYRNFMVGGNAADQPDTVNIGIDPTGGINPDAPSVVWNVGADIFPPNQPWREVSVEAVSQTDVITVFVRFVQKFGLNFNLTAADLVEVELPQYDARSIGDARAQADGANITFLPEANLIVTVSPISETGYFYMQDADGTAGIRVETDNPLPPVGAKVSVTGKLDTNASGERVLRNATVSVIGTGQTPIWTVNNRNVGGPGYVGATAGAVNQGLLVRVFGRVTEFNFLDGYFLIDDGSGVDAGEGKKGIRVIKAEVYPGVGDYISIVGAVSARIIDGKKVRVIHGREGTVPSDFVTY
jgi:hypothetical protein